MTNTRIQAQNHAARRWKAKSAGRLVRKDYVFSMDDKEGGRLRYEHLIMQLAIPKLFFAPIRTKAMEAVLDVGCGSGLWALEMARKYPGTQIVALDIDPVPFQLTREKDGPLPNNLIFIERDARQPLPSNDSTYDFVHCHFPDPIVPRHLWTPFLHELLRVVKPEGWVELVVGGHPFHNNQQTTTAYCVILEALRVLCEDILGVWQACLPHLDLLLNDAGIIPQLRMTHIVGQSRNEAMNRKIMKLWRNDLSYMISSTRPLVLQFGIMPEQEFDSQLATYIEDMDRIGIYLPVGRVCFQRKDCSSTRIEESLTKVESYER